MAGKKDKSGKTEAVMGLGDHLDELRRSVIRSLLGILPLVILCAWYGQYILDFMLEPALGALRAEDQNARLSSLSPLESFSTYFYVAVMSGLVIGAPWVIYQLWSFVAPGLYSHERRFAYVLAPLSLILSIAGFLVMRFGMMPAAMAFLTHFGAHMLPPHHETAEPSPGIVFPTVPTLQADPEKPVAGQMWFNGKLAEMRYCVGVDAQGQPKVLGAPFTATTTIHQEYRLSEVVDLFVQMSLIFVLSFQLPVVVLLLGWAGIVNPTMLGKYRKYAFAIAVVGSAVIAPTGDPLSLAMLQVPLYLLYELGIVLLRIFPASKLSEKEDDAGRDEPEIKEPAPPEPPGGPADGP